MANRVDLKDVAFTPKVQNAIITAGSAYIYKLGTTTQASVYSSLTDASAETQPVSWNSAYGLQGFVAPGYYTVSAGNVTQDVFVRPPDHFRALDLGVCTLPRGLYDIKDDLAMTSGTVIFAKFEPVTAPFTANRIAVYFGDTEDVSITVSKAGIYSSDGTTLTRVIASAHTAANGATPSTRATYTITETTVSPGTEYWGAIILVASTAPSIMGVTPAAGGGITTYSALDSPANAKTLGSQTDLDATEAIAGTTASFSVPYMQLSYVAA